MVRRPAGAALALLLSAVGPAGAQAPAEEPAPPETPELLGAPAAFGAEAEAEERVAVPEGTLLRELPDPRSPSLATIDAPSELPVIERSGPWYRVRYGALVGWVALDAPLPPKGEPEKAGEAPPAAPPRSPVERPRQPREGHLTIPALPSAQASDGGARRRALAAAETWAGPPPASGRPSVGGWLLFTDLDDPPLVGFLDRVAAGLAEVYRERYGLDPGSPDGDAVVLFAREADYREFAGENASLLGIGEGGHAAHGVAALYAGERGRDELASLLVHELTHLMNARALGSRTPPWLEEGLADDLGFSEIDRKGRLQPGTVGGAERRRASFDPSRALTVRVTWEGGKGAVVALARLLDDDRLPAMELVARLSWIELVDPEDRSALYAQSTFFVRYLLDREPAAFRGYLRYLASGGSDEPEALTESLGRDWASLDADFRRWLLDRVEELGLLESR